MINDKRNSAFELIRLVAMFMIVVYHILMYFIVPIANTSLYQAMYLFCSICIYTEIYL
jgi:surface polysaccharide O-acyltransferase-like enzyme